MKGKAKRTPIVVLAQRVVGLGMEWETRVFEMRMRWQADGRGLVCAPTARKQHPFLTPLFVFPADEGRTWAKGWNTPAANALRAAAALS